MLWATFDPTITWGTVIGVVNLILFLLACFGAWVMFKTRVELNLKQVADVIAEVKASNIAVAARFETALTSHEKRDETMFDEFQKRLTDLVGGVQRLIGQSEVTRRDRA